MKKYLFIVVVFSLLFSFSNVLADIGEQTMADGTTRSYNDAGSGSFGDLRMPNANGLPTSGTMDGMLIKITNILVGLVGSLAILMIIISGVMYITSGGDSGKADNAKNLLTYSIIGLVVVILAYVIVKTVATALGA